MLEFTPGIAYLVYQDEETSFIFRKYAGKSGTVNIFTSDGEEIDVFTSYSIEADPDLFAYHCNEWIKHLKEQEE